MENYAVEIENLSKKYYLYKRPADRIVQMFLKRRKLYTEHTALTDINMKLKKAETVGIIGRNGAGKSTLLKLITGVTTPDTGSIKISGKIASLLELGTGFNPEFTGIENVYLNASFLKLKKVQIDGRLDEIIKFADIGKYIYQPVKTYSSGMKARLAFSIAVNVDPDILILDEVLAVGDVFFQRKCYGKFHEYRDRGITIIFVTHSLKTIERYADKAFLLHKGKLISEGEPSDVIKKYYRINDPHSTPREEKEIIRPDRQASTLNDEKIKLNPLYNDQEYITGNESAEFLEIELINKSKSGRVNGYFDTNDEVEIHLKYKVYKDCDYLVLGLDLKTTDGLHLFGSKKKIGEVKKDSEISSVIKFRNVLTRDNYFFTFYLADRITHELRIEDVIMQKREDVLLFNVVKGASKGLFDGNINFE
jgi:teichoic acid transport system ATP-binding protein